MHIEFARQIDEILGTNGFFVRNCGAAAKSKYPDHFAAAAEAEALATAIREYAPQLIPGCCRPRRTRVPSSAPTNPLHRLGSLMSWSRTGLSERRCYLIQQPHCFGVSWTRRFSGGLGATKQCWRRRSDTFRP